MPAPADRSIVDVFSRIASPLRLLKFSRYRCISSMVKYAITM